MRTIIEMALNGHAHRYGKTGLTIGQVNAISNDSNRESFKPISSYRLLEVGTYEGIRFVNDSKSTNVNSTWWALEEISSPIIWIAGGLEKGNDYSILMDLVKEKVEILIPLGKENKHLRSAFEGLTTITDDCYSMDEAVVCARRIAESGSTVLLAPACASFDLFENYEHRGYEFVQSVRRNA